MRHVVLVHGVLRILLLLLEVVIVVCMKVWAELVFPWREPTVDIQLLLAAAKLSQGVRISIGRALHVRQLIRLLGVYSHSWVTGSRGFMDVWKNNLDLVGATGLV